MDVDRLVEILRAREPAPGVSVHDQRRYLEDAVARMPLVDGVVRRDVHIGSRHGELAAPEGSGTDRTILYLHGGGFAIGSVRTVRPLTSNIARACDAAVLSVDYRLAPEHPHPAALDDAVGAYEWLLASGATPERIFLAGDSAGGGLVVSTLVRARDRGLPLPAGGICLSPWTDLRLTAPSLDRNGAGDPAASRWRLQEMADLYLAGSDAATPTASPLLAELSGLPPLLIHVGAAEALLDDSVQLAATAARDGVDVTLRCYPRMIHVWHAYAPLLAESMAAIDEIAAWMFSRA